MFPCFKERKTSFLYIFQFLRKNNNKGAVFPRKKVIWFKTKLIIKCQKIRNVKTLKLDVLYTDFLKAFDKVSHLNLTHKLRAYGFGCRLIDWIIAYLIGRKQRVVIGESRSSWCDVDSGVSSSIIELFI